MRRGFPLAVLLLLSLCFTNSDVGARQAGDTDPLFDAHGMQENRSYFSLLPFEHIDMLTGNLILKFTDLVLPGDAGLDVRIGRTYNSKGTAGWRFGLEGVPYSVQNPDGVPAGAPDPQASFPKLQMADGATHELFPEAQFSYSVFRTRQFWRYHVSGRRLELPDGTVCFYGSSGQLTAIQDAFQNRIDLSYRFNLELERVRQTLGSGQVREVTFGSGGVAGKIPMTMTYLDRTWFYHTDNDGMLLTFRPPAGPDWLFGYDFFNTRVLRSVTTPNGGRVEYVFRLLQLRRRQWRGRVTRAADSPFDDRRVHHPRRLGVRLPPNGRNACGRERAGQHTHDLPAWHAPRRQRTGPADAAAIPQPGDARTGDLHVRGPRRHAVGWRNRPPSGFADRHPRQSNLYHDLDVPPDELWRLRAAPPDPGDG